MQNFELSEETVSAWLSCRLIQLEKLAVQKQNELKKAPDGVLRVAQRRGKPQLYVKSSKTSNKEKYLSVKKLDVASRLAQKDYDKKLLRLLNRQIVAIKKFRKSFISHSLTAVYDRLIPFRKKLVVPAILSQEDFVNLWLEEKSSGRGFDDDYPKYITEHGERVRSKSEIIIADLLFRSGIPYKYEAPLELNSYGTVYPDFTCLNVRNRREFIWEHFGLMNDPEYVQKALKKIQDYMESGFLPGKNLLMTFEGGNTVLSTRSVQKIIENFLS